MVIFYSYVKLPDGYKLQVQLLPIGLLVEVRQQMTLKESSYLRQKIIIESLDWQPIAS